MFELFISDGLYSIGRPASIHKPSLFIAFIAFAFMAFFMAGCAAGAAWCAAAFFVAAIVQNTNCGNTSEITA